MSQPALGECTLAQVQGLVGSAFAVQGPTGAVSLRLVEVADLGRRAADFKAPGGVSVRLECFSLTFAGPTSQPLQQGTWSVTRDGRSEPEAVFLVPVQRAGDELRYEAVYF
ncbi:MAG: hypothetical protein KC457_28715 [Myxococcales bacterium]|nr:hypothetical protein [Myxococcales bacterium]